MPYLNFLSGKSQSSLSPSPLSDRWVEFVDDNDTLYDDDGRDIIRALTGEGIRHQYSFDEFLSDRTSETDYMSPTRPNSTASGKQFALHDLNIEPDKAFMSKHPKQWVANDIMQWTLSIAQYHNYNYEHICMPSFNVDGLTLCNMTEKDFVSRNPDIGKMLFLSLQSIINDHECKGISSPLPTFNSSFPYPILTELGEERKDFTTQSTKSETSTDKESNTHIGLVRPQKRPPGRPKGIRSKRKPEKKCGRLWEFIRDLLLNRDYCPSLICWDDHDQGVFRFVRSEKVAQLWGTIKENPKMTYEKLSRAMRYYYKSKVLQPVLGRRLVYKFGPTATGWRTPNPNFRLSL